MKNYSKTFKLIMLALIVISAVVTVIGFVAGFESNGGNMTDLLLYWTYAMVAITVLSLVIFGIAIGYKNNPKGIVKGAIVVVAVAVVCFLVYLISPGSPAVGLTNLTPSHSELKLTDTMLNLTYIAGVAAILAIIAGEIVMSVRNKQAKK